MMMRHLSPLALILEQREKLFPVIIVIPLVSIIWSNPTRATDSVLDIQV